MSRFLNRNIVTLGTDGFGRSEDRASLRNFFEVDARYVTAATLAALLREKAVDLKVVKQAYKELEIDAEKVDPAVV
jgi:pyruvate dehydrogenase E1 component